MGLIRSKLKKEMRDREKGEGPVARAVKTETPRRNNRRS